MADLVFISWNRRAGEAITPETHGRPVAELSVTATDTSGGCANATPEFVLHGPGDVVGLKPGAVTVRYPRPGQADAEPAFCPYVELAAPDIPWRYSPRGADPSREMEPWLALLAVLPAEVDRGERSVTVDASVLDGHPLAGTAHVQRSGGHEVSRVMCRRPLEKDTDYLALLVPVFGPDGAPHWVAAGAVTLPVYDEWWFHTGEEGTFETLAQQLHAADDLGQFGRISVALGDGPGESVAVRGALTSVGDPSDPPPPTAATARLAALLAFDPDAGEPGHEPGFDSQGRRYVRPPDYGEAWLTRVRAGAPAGGWVEQVNADPTHRVVAGLGVQAGVDLQDEIVAAAADRLGATAAANQRIAAVAAGLAAARSLWDRRVAPLERNTRIRLLGLAAERVLARGADGAVGPLLHHATGPDRTLPSALFSTAAHRLLRQGAARLRHAAPEATSILDAANQPRPAVRRPDDAPGDPRHRDGVASGDALVASVGGFRIGERDVERVERGDDLVPALLLHRLDEVDGERLAAALARIPIEGLERPSPRPVDLVAFDYALTRAFDPRADPLAARRVRATIVPDDDPEPLKPREPCPDLDLPAWRYLRDKGRHWLLPGAEALEDGEVVALASNPVFSDAFLVGLNTQALGELRWRNLTVAAGCTPLRDFWERSREATPGMIESYEADDDISGIRSWVAADPGQPDPRGVALGHQSHTNRPGEDPRQLVVVFCTDLFRRYPGTLVYLVPPVVPGDWADADLPRRTLPAFTARVTPKIVLFAFPTPPEAIWSHWVVVEQQPPGFRFELADDQGGTSAARAAAMFQPPVRVLLAGPTLRGGV